MIFEKNNRKFVYRLRSLEKILGNDYQELERQVIYFAPFPELNDPMEGFCEISWFGDSIVWKNLFRHYLLCMEYQVSTATLYSPEVSEQFFKREFPIFISEAELPTDLYRQNFKVIKDRFFSYEPINQLVSYLGNKKSPLRKNQLLVILWLISDIALESILFGHDDAGFQPQPFWMTLQNSINERPLLKQFVDAIKMGDSNSEEQIDAIFSILAKEMQENNLKMLCEKEEVFNKITWSYFRSVFQQEYLEYIPQLVYPNWYSASFISEFPKNSVLWGHYGDSNMGVCLVFKAHDEDHQKNLHILLKRPENGSHGSVQKMHLNQIYYSDEREFDVEFFKRLWTQPAYIVHNEWYSDESGQKSPNISEMNPTEETRLAYWDKLKSIQTTKTTNWRYECECRILINGGFYDFSKPKNRIFKYDFNELEGIIFGMRTPVVDKVKIIKIIGQKCMETKRTDFKFYQSRFDYRDSSVVCDEIQSLKFSV